MNHLTIDSEPAEAAELERMAYGVGDTDIARLLGLIAELLENNQRMEDKIDKLEDDSLEDWETDHGSAQDYHDFFYACFDRLDGHYPAPSVSSDYDCSVVFDAIERGESK